MSRVRELDKILSDPEILWAVLTSGVKVADCWEVATSKDGMVSHHKGLWRLPPNVNNSYLVLVCPSRKLEKPEPYDFATDWNHDEDDSFDYDEEAYANAVVFYQDRLKKWKPWTFCLTVSHHEIGYAETQEEAQQKADEILTGYGVLLREPK